MAFGDGSERIRTYAWSKYIEPQILQGKSQIELAIKPVMKDLEAQGFPPNRPRQFCTALQEKSFLREKGLVVDRVDGPPSGTSTTVVLHLRVKKPADNYESVHLTATVSPEEADARAKRVVDSLRGLLKDEIAAFGGAEAFMRWVRSDDEDEAA